MLIWLASYPKSGNTWLRAFLTAYRFPQTELNINHLLGQPVCCSREYFDNWVGIDSSLLREEELHSYLRDFYQCLGSQELQMRLVKTHAICEEGVFPQLGCQGTIYVVRHPFDVVVSWSHHQCVDFSAAVNFVMDQKASLNRLEDGLHTHFPEKLGDWASHVESWLEFGPEPRLFIRYEDLLSHPEETFTKAIKHLGWEVCPARLASAVQRSGFSVLKKQEESFGYRGRQPTAGSFFRAGVKGQGRRLPLNSRERMFESFRHTMERFEYRGRGFP